MSLNQSSSPPRSKRVSWLWAVAACSTLAADESLLGTRKPPTEPDQAAATLIARPGFRAELVASEPLVASPVAIAVDEQGRAYVVEMRDYSERRPERLGRIRRLTDSDRDGRYDHATEFVKNLPWPTAVTCWDGGVFVGATPDVLYAKDTDGDGTADILQAVFTGFASDYAPYETNRLNVQALMNSFQWGPDARIHGAASLSGGKVRLVDSEFTRDWRKRFAAPSDFRSADPSGVLDLRGRDFSWDPRTLELRAETGGGQHGMSFDDTGRKFVCSNSDHLQLVAFNEARVPANRFHEMPVARRSIAADGPAAEVFRRSPDESWRVLRTRWRVAGVTPGLIEGGGRASGYFTGATGVTLYRGDAYGPEFEGAAFIADCGSNLIHRKRLRPDADGVLLIGERPADELRSEFLASTDNWFRPVQFYNGPDGCLWVVDMYREVIEHPWSLPAPLKSQLDLDSGRDRGRIWRIVREGSARPKALALDPGAPATTLIAKLAHPNGWVRDTAARLIYQRTDARAISALQSAADEWSALFPGASARAAASGKTELLGLLAGFHALKDDQIEMALRDSNQFVRSAAVRWAANRVPGSPGLTEALTKLASSELDPLVGLELCWALARVSPDQRVSPLAELMTRGSTWAQSAAIHAAGEAAPKLWRQLTLTNRASFPNQTSALAELVNSLGRQADTNLVAATLAQATRWQPEDAAVELTASLGEGFRRQGGQLLACDPDGSFRRLAQNVLARLRASPGTASAAEVRLASLLPAEEATPVLLAAAREGASSVRPSALEALGRLQGDPWAAALTTAVTNFPPDLRPRLLALLISRPEGVRALLHWLREAPLRVEQLDPATVAALRENSSESVRAEARELLGEPPTDRRSVVEAFVPALREPGNPERGATLFRELCASCHRWQGEGAELGPDLASVVANGREKLLVAILDPNREVAPNFVAWIAESDSGETVTGIVSRQNAESVTLKMAGGTEATFAGAALRSLRPTGRSLMPEGLEAGLSPGALADLLAFLGAR